MFLYDFKFHCLQKLLYRLLSLSLPGILAQQNAPSADVSIEDFKKIEKHIHGSLFFYSPYLTLRLNQEPKSNAF